MSYFTLGRSLGALGELRNGDVDPQTGLIWDDIQGTWRTAEGVSPAYEAAKASYPENPFTSMTEQQKAIYYATKYGPAAAQDLAAVYQGTGINYATATPEQKAAAAQSFIDANAASGAALVKTVETAQASSIATASYKNDYIAQSGGDLGTWYALQGGGERYTRLASGTVIDNALLAYQALKSGGANVSALDASAAAAQSENDARYADSLTRGGIQTNPSEPPPASVVNGALDAIVAAGGDATKPTAIVDDRTGQVIAIATRNADGSASVTVPPAGGSSHSLAGIVNTVTGAIDKVAGTIDAIGTEVGKVGNAIRGGAAGASAGYNFGDPKTLIIGAGALLALLAFAPRRRR